MRFYFYKIYNTYDKIKTGDTIELHVGTMLYSNSEMCANVMKFNMAKPGQKRMPTLFDVTLLDESVAADEYGIFKVTLAMTNRSARVNRVQLSAPILFNLKGESAPKNQAGFFPKPASVNSSTDTDENEFLPFFGVDSDSDSDFAPIPETDFDVEHKPTSLPSQ